MSPWHAAARDYLQPPAQLSIADWADENYYLSPESSAEPGRWKTLPYQRGIMDAISDPDVEQVSFKKSARVGATKMLNATIGYYMEHDPCAIMVVQPTIPDARGYSNEEIAPMLRDCPALRDVLKTPAGAKKKSQTVLNKYYKGGSLSMIGANSGAGFRRVSRRVVLFDEVDAYPASAGDDGDPIALGIKRTDYFANRKIVAVSTPLIEGASRITDLFEEGDQRRYHVPCTQCGFMDFLTFRKREDGRGHRMVWPRDEPEGAHFVCSENGCVIEHHDKFEMLSGGDWIAEQPFEGHASFHIWAAYSMSPNASWAKIAKAFLKAKKAGLDRLRTFINTVLGETFAEAGEVPDWERLYNLREHWPVRTIPEGAPIVAITCGVDVQQNRWVYEVVGWSLNKESWSLDAGVIYGDPSNDDEWRKLEELLESDYGGRSIDMMAVDSGNWTQTVYNWCAQYPMSRVIAVKGRAKSDVMVKTPSKVEIKANGKRSRRSYKLWPVGVSIVKRELYGFLKLAKREDEPYPPGYCHFPEHGEDFFLQLTGEHLIRVTKKGGYKVFEWAMIPGRENHYLDTRVYARAAAHVLGLDRSKGNGKPPAKKKQPPKEQDTGERGQKRRKGGGFMGKRGKGWMGRR